MRKDTERTKPPACQRNRLRTMIHNRVRDKLAHQLSRMGATVDLERSAPLWTTRLKSARGEPGRFKLAHIDVGASRSGSRQQ